ncbi:hypothetical protein STEG23_003905 [Scotinomys teguina]
MCATLGQEMCTPYKVVHIRITVHITSVPIWAQRPGSSWQHPTWRGAVRVVMAGCLSPGSEPRVAATEHLQSAQKPERSQLGADEHDDLADENPGHCALGLPKGTMHTCLEPVSPSTGQHLVDSDDMERVEPHSNMKAINNSVAMYATQSSTTAKSTESFSWGGTKRSSGSGTRQRHPTRKVNLAQSAHQSGAAVARGAGVSFLLDAPFSPINQRLQRGALIPEIKPSV